MGIIRFSPAFFDKPLFRQIGPLQSCGPRSVSMEKNLAHVGGYQNRVMESDIISQSNGQDHQGNPQNQKEGILNFFLFSGYGRKNPNYGRQQKKQGIGLGDDRKAENHPG